MKRRVLDLAAVVTVALSTLVAVAAHAGAEPASTPSIEAQQETGNKSASARSCYGSGGSFFLPAGQRDYPTDGTLITTANCADVNIRPSSNIFVRICYTPIGAEEYICQRDFKNAVGGQWTAVATNMRDDVSYFFSFVGSTSDVRGSYAG